MHREEALFGSIPSHPATHQAIYAQPPGHFCSIPAERASDEMDKGEAQLIRDMGLSRQQQGHLCSIPAERAPDPLDEEIARLERYEEALLVRNIALLRQQLAEEQ